MVDDVADPIEADRDSVGAERQMEELHAHCKRIREKHRNVWKEHADIFPHVRSWLGRVTQPVRKNLRQVARVARATREYGALVEERTGCSKGTQMHQQLRLYVRHWLPAECYYALGMYRKQARKQAPLFFGDRSGGLLLHQLAKHAPQKEYEALKKKTTFWRHCRDHGLPAVPVLAVFEEGRLKDGEAELNGALSPRDLFSKPVTAFLGEGTRRWRTAEEGGFKDEVGQRHAPEAVIEALKKQSQEEAVLLQPRASDHPRLQKCTGLEGPSTVRIVTARTPGGEPEYFAGALTSPLKAVAAPTFKAKTALAAPIDSQTGALGRLRSKQGADLLDGRERHPRTGEEMAGLELPDWDEAKALALRAHAMVPHIPCVGWDLVLTADGPRLLEGNTDCSAVLIQITHQTLLGHTRLPSYLLAHLQRTKLR